MAKLVLAEYGIPKIVSDAGTKMSEMLKEFCKMMNIQWSITSSYHNQSNGQVEAC